MIKNDLFFVAFYFCLQLPTFFPYIKKINKDEHFNFLKNNKFEILMNEKLKNILFVSINLSKEKKCYFKYEN